MARGEKAPRLKQMKKAPRAGTSRPGGSIKKRRIFPAQIAHKKTAEFPRQKKRMEKTPGVSPAQKVYQNSAGFFPAQTAHEKTAGFSRH
ncbi:hypothetical protein [Candidatus Allofournierella excrementavium]|uniref:hypothetical protein n=1 Tax=Candidatus Allofournierella excrementavium TaxID=2838591 RepID=UPI003A83DF3B